MAAKKPPGGTLGKRIMQERLRAGAERGKPMTQTELATAVGVKPPTVSQWEADAAEPELAMIVKVAEALGTSPAYLAFGTLAADGFTPPNQWGSGQTKRSS